MADPIIINPTMTLAGQAAAFNASDDGFELKITAVSYGRAHYNPTGEELALVDPVGSKMPLAGGSRPTPYQLRMVSSWREDVGEVPIGEVGFWAGDVLAFVWSKADGTRAGFKTDGVAYVLFNDLAFAQVPANSISFEIDPSESVALAALAAHEGALNAHPQYLLRADVAKDSGPLSWLGLAGGTANVLVLSLDAPESELPALAPGQRFQFLATQTNTLPVTATVEGHGPIAVKRGGDAGLVDLDPGDIKAGSLYDLNYDGTYWQLGGGVGSGKAFERFSFVAGVAQAVFNFPHTPGSLIGLRNGREIYDFASAGDGSKVTLAIPANLDDRIEFLAFKSFKVADSYTKAELNALLITAGAMPVGSMLPMPTGVVPPGYLELDGSVKSIAAYPDLAAYLGTAFNTGGEGAGNFRLPESRAEFFRGWDHGRGVDAGRAIGSYQLDDFKSHTHGYGADANLPVGSGNTVLQSGGSKPTTATGGTETRPRNLAVMWCIKAWNAPINQGNIDIAALLTEVQALRNTVASGHKGLFVSATGTNALIAIRARRLVVGNGITARALDRLDLSVNLATVGLGGLDAGVLAASSWYSTWVATNGEVNAGIAALIPVVTGTTTAGSPVVTALASTALMRPGMQFGGANFPPGAFIKSVDSPTQITASIPATTTGAGASLRFLYEPVLPAGYTAKRVNAFVTDGTANKFPLGFNQTGRNVQFLIGAGKNLLLLPQMAVGAQGSVGTTMVAVSVAAFVPLTATRIRGVVFNGGGITSTQVAANSIGTIPGSTAINASVGSNGGASFTVGFDFALESAFLYYAGTSAGCEIRCLGWEDDL